MNYRMNDTYAQVSNSFRMHLAMFHQMGPQDEDAELEDEEVWLYGVGMVVGIISKVATVVVVVVVVPPITLGGTSL